jgi:hypothetical protein
MIDVRYHPEKMPLHYLALLNMLHYMILTHPFHNRKVRLKLTPTYTVIVVFAPI